MTKILVIFGTRPEAIKMSPLIKELRAFPHIFNVKVCVTAQHRQMLDAVLSFFEIVPDYDLNLMRPQQNLYQLTADVIVNLKPVLEDFLPDIVLIHGDTTTSTSASLAAFYAGSKVGHIEAGLRSNNKYAPFPEEINRQITARIADFHFSPTKKAKQNLLDEKITEAKIFITGNTIIDALFWAKNKLQYYYDDEIKMLKGLLDETQKIILVTGHRRENFGEGFSQICKAIKQIANERQDVQFVYPVHPNPNVQVPVYQFLSNVPNIHLIKPLDYPAFVWLMLQSYLILTDSGGIQEEAPSLGKPVLVMRDLTERPEAIEAGTAKIVGTDFDKITSNILTLLSDKSEYNRMSIKHNLYGDGTACKKIVQILINQLND
jgi:UDP-N-acetylglucosamine 2-epimerase (non-hydrolysing)